MWSPRSPHSGHVQVVAYPGWYTLFVYIPYSGKFSPGVNFRHVVQVVKINLGKFYLVCGKLSLRTQAPFTFTTKDPPGPPEVLTTLLLASALQWLVGTVPKITRIHRQHVPGQVLLLRPGYTVLLTHAKLTQHGALTHYQIITVYLSYYVKSKNCE